MKSAALLFGAQGLLWLACAPAFAEDGFSQAQRVQTEQAPAQARAAAPAAAHAGPRTQAPVQALAAANSSARQQPNAARFDGARQIYRYEPGALYELYAHPDFISTVLLEPGERLIDIAAGDTTRWMVTQTEAETQTTARAIVLVKPQTANLRTNIVLITDRRTYLIEAIGQAGPSYAAQLAWTYPQEPSPEPPPQLEDLNLNYRIAVRRGPRPAWMPLRAFDDGRRTFVEFPQHVAATDMPPLFVMTAEGAEIVNYRVQGQRYMIDRLFDVAELRLGVRAPIIVRIERRSAQAPTGRQRRARR